MQFDDIIRASYALLVMTTKTSSKPPRLQDVAPQLVEEIRQLLADEGRPDLSDQVTDLLVVDRCRCGDEFCGSFYTVPRPSGSYGPDHYTLALSPRDGMLNVDVVEEKIVQIEVLYRDELRDKIRIAMP